MSGADIDVVTAITEKLGRARVQSSGEFEPAVTHIVTAKVSRSEKLLCCTAAGKWVLHPDFITDSEKVSFSRLGWPVLSHCSFSLQAGHWLSELDYEWGNQQNNLIKAEEVGLLKLASAARKWRLQDGGPFEGMKFVVNSPGNKGGPFKR